MSNLKVDKVYFNVSVEVTMEVRMTGMTKSITSKTVVNSYLDLMDLDN